MGQYVALYTRTDGCNTQLVRGSLCEHDDLLAVSVQLLYGDASPRELCSIASMSVDDSQSSRRSVPGSTRRCPFLEAFFLF